jgi:hypothetical protein
MGPGNATTTQPVRQNAFRVGYRGAMRRIVTTLALSAVLAVTGVASAACDPTGSDVNPRSTEPPCATGPESIRSDRRFTDQDLPGIGDYVEMHWLARAQGNPCSRVPGPTDVQYYGIVQLRPTDATTLATAYQWAAASLPPQIPPELASFLPPSAAWQRSTGYPTMVAGHAVVLYLDPAQAVAFFVLSTM